MKLPVIALPTGSVEIGGETIEFRSLSRSEALQMSGFAGLEDDAENFILACGIGVTIEEAAAWRGATALEPAGQLVDAIIFISGLSRTGRADPNSKPPSSEP